MWGRFPTFFYSQKFVKSELEAVVESALDALGFDLVDLRRGGSRSRPVVEIRIDRRDGEKVTVEDCARASRALEVHLDNGELGDHIPNAVPKVASLGLTVHDVDNWSGDIKLRYIGKYPLSQDNTLVGSSAIVTNLRLQRTLTSSVSLTLDVLNLFDRRYYDIEYEQDYRASLASAPVPDGISVHPGEPREVRLSLDLKL